MYHGVANIYQDNLDGFLALAEELQLKGLTGGTENPPEENKENQEIKKKKIPKDYGSKRSDTYYSSINNKLDNYYDEDTKPINNVMTLDNSAPQVHFNGGSAEDLKSTLWSMIYQNGTVLTCNVC